MKTTSFVIVSVVFVAVNLTEKVAPSVGIPEAVPCMRGPVNVIPVGSEPLMTCDVMVAGGVASTVMV